MNKKQINFYIFPRKFIKVQSLGNDFILFLYDKAIQESSFWMLPEWRNHVIWLCDRHCGIGADGVLVLVHGEQGSLSELLVFNADGSQAARCLNGLRCVAYYMALTYNILDLFYIKVGTCLVACLVENDVITIRLPGIVSIIGQKMVEVEATSYTGTFVDSGNPHFFIFKEQCYQLLERHGSIIESHVYFPDRTNVEFVWPATEKNTWHMLVYERGVGVTNACSSGVAALIGLFVHNDIIKYDQNVTIHMPGGSVFASMNTHNEIVLNATASIVFRGTVVM